MSHVISSDEHIHVYTSIYVHLCIQRVIKVDSPMFGATTSDKTGGGGGGGPGGGGGEGGGGGGDGWNDRFTAERTGWKQVTTCKTYCD